MPGRPFAVRVFTSALISTLSFALLSRSLPASADPAAGFVDEWTGNMTNNWAGGAMVSNPGTGGRGGAGDVRLGLARE